MTVKRIMGIETEYGISCTSNSAAHENHALLSFEQIQAVAKRNPHLRHVMWDYGFEDPVHDARGFHMPRAHVNSDLLTDRENFRSTNVPQPNGARIYVDHAHPEYSSPEVLTPQQALIYDRAGDAIMHEAAQSTHDDSNAQLPLTLYRNNVDGKGSSWGSHENYQVKRAVSFNHLATIFTTHAVTRQIYTGTGRVGIGEKSEKAGFQISQRADYFKTDIGLQTTYDRPIVNTRDESHSTSEYRRFHVITGDANRMDVPEILKLGTTSLLLWALEECVQREISYDDFLQSMTLKHPVNAMHEVSHDLALTHALEMYGGEDLTAFQCQLRLRSWIYSIAAAVYETDSRGEPLWPDDETKEIMDLWAQALKDIAQLIHADDNERLTLKESAARLEWFAKWQILESMRRRKECAWDNPLMQAMDISWAQMGTNSLWNKISSRTQKIASDAAISYAMGNPPDNTRAYTRGMCLQKYAPYLTAISWDSAIFSNNEADKPIVISLANPAQHTREEMTDTFTAEHKIEEVLSRLA
ncbi:proteasome accessory factor PafA2 [Alloscardovia theropitheci]|uniref:Proteasome accessory factor PafA2 n=1 Tax=Alloscardovia theropitheci TaxID=2496842 RepID=A0A4R0QRC6_9BIFI|nr:depupylase/deamidase Dop [Alloscardovia theropitheci]TCD54904.1 proteasome accessory factor PafA2 [Alloscardovia theropitheci]